MGSTWLPRRLLSRHACRYNLDLKLREPQGPREYSHAPSIGGRIKMPCLFFNETDVEQIVSMPDAVEAVAGAFRALARGEADNVPRARAKGTGLVLHSMSATASYLGLAGWKQYTTTRHGARFHVGLYDLSTGELVALLEADRLGQLRTGAVTGLAARYLAPSDARQVGLLGSGWQAQSQLEAVAHTLALERAVIFSRNEKRRDEFCHTMSRRLNLPVTPARSAREAAEHQPVVITATSSATPVLEAPWVSPESLVCAVGSNWPQKAEVTADVVSQSSLVVCDNVECCRREAGDLIQACEQGHFDWNFAREFSDIVSQVGITRAPDGQRVFFKSVGMAVEDVALAAVVLQRGRERGLGLVLPGLR